MVRLFLVLLLFSGVSVAEEITGNPHIIDGDSIRIADVEIRLRRIDAPEGKQTCRYQGNDWACGQPLAGV
jgi:endonuclease YncB( thermonuclease family)